MKKIINDKLYNTETAKLIAKSETTTDHSDFGYYCKEIYKKKTGEYFLYKYGFVYACGYTWEEKITPLTTERTKRILESMEEDGIDAYITEFGAEE